MLYSPAVRLTSHEIEYIARRIVKTLVAEGKIEVDDDSHVAEGIARTITEEMQKEDRLNEEVREVLSRHSSEMARGDITYTEMFKMVKRKLAKEKGIIL